MIKIEPGSATGIGSLPGTDIAEAVRFTFGELPLPYLPELPDRGPGTEMIGRTAGLLLEFPVELYVGRWRVASRPGVDARRTHDWWSRDLDALVDQAGDHRGPLKVQVAGPWTLAASIELPHGQAVLSDHGAARDLAASLAEGLRQHVAEVQRRVPGAEVIVQIDEPSLPAVLAGAVRTPSGLQTYRSVSAQVAREALTAVAQAAPTIFHCCAADAPLDLFREAGAAGIAVDLDRVELDPLGEAIDAGLTLLAGVAPATGSRAPTSVQLFERVRRPWRTLGFSESQLAGSVVITPACGLAGATPAYARAVQLACAEAGRRMLDLS